jgi:phosphopantothenoylcysteine decarboxylase/phosphopantothenate--cysteine ligase
MSSLSQKRVIVGVTGGIAAYKSPDVVRRLRDAGASVRVVMTTNAEQFITPLTLQAVSDHPVHRSNLLDADAESAMSHIELARWADAVLIAPASADFIARMAHGLANDLLSTLCLATEARIAIAPAMNQQMWQHAATQDNVTLLVNRGVTVFGPASGSQACGEVGPGRMPEPTELVESLSALYGTGDLAGAKVVITAGPTHEAIDPVRNITNRSSGKMGYAVAQAAAEAGADVVLVSGPSHLPYPDGVQVVPVTSALEMQQAVMAEITDADIFIGVAAVADYRPAEFLKQKIKKSSSDQLTIKLVKNPDILATVAALDDPPFTVGFAAETHNVEAHAREKLMRKGLYMIAANRVGDIDVGLESDENELLILDRTDTKSLPRMYKQQLARKLIEEIAIRYRAEGTNKNTRRAHR